MSRPVDKYIVVKADLSPMPTTYLVVELVHYGCGDRRVDRIEGITHDMTSDLKKARRICAEMVKDHERFNREK